MAKKRNDCVSWCIENEPLTRQMLCTHNLLLSFCLSFAFLKYILILQTKSKQQILNWDRKKTNLNVYCTHIVYAHDIYSFNNCSDSKRSFRVLFLFIQNPHAGACIHEDWVRVPRCEPKENWIVPFFLWLLSIWLFSF